MTDGKCDLCGEENYRFRGCTFGKKHRELCSKCLSQWKNGNEGFPVLSDRFE